MQLSDKSRLILEAIAKGHTYEQILVQDLAWTYHDIFQAAAEALEEPKDAIQEEKTYQVEAIRLKCPQAYRKWDPEQEAQLLQLFYDGKTEKEIAQVMQRQVGGIRSRLAKLIPQDELARRSPIV